MIGRRTFSLDGDYYHYGYGNSWWFVYSIHRRKKEATCFQSVPVGNFENLSSRQRKVWVAMALRKNRDKPSDLPQADDKMAQSRWPALWDHLTQKFWDVAGKDGRRTSTVTLFLRPDGRLGAVLSDKEGSRSCFAAACDILTLLDILEGVATSDDTQWREDRTNTGSSKRKKD
jgi:hypothetical protein